MNGLHIRSIIYHRIVLDVSNLLTALTLVLRVIAPFPHLRDRTCAAAAKGNGRQPAKKRPQPSGVVRISNNAAEIREEAKEKEREREMFWDLPGVFAGDQCGLGLLARLTSRAVDKIGIQAQSVGGSDEACIADCLANFRQLHSCKTNAV